MAGRDRGHLPRRDVHVVDLRARHVVDLAALTANQDAILGERAITAQDGVRLGLDVPVLLVGGQVVDVVGDGAVLDLRYGVSMKPNGLTRANVESAPIRPMFGLGVSIGHIRP
jgi:hypothetical protein